MNKDHPFRSLEYRQDADTRLFRVSTLTADQCAEALSQPFDPYIQHSVRVALLRRLRKLNQGTEGTQNLNFG